MDELSLMRSFRAERARRNPAARAAAWQALEDRFEAAAEIAAPAARPPRLLSHRRLLAFAAASAAAVVAAAAIVVGSGPTAQPAAAQILRETAAVAVSPEGPPSSPLPGPGQFLYTKIKRLELQSWLPGCSLQDDRACLFGGGLMSGADTFGALMPTTQEEWMGEDGSGRHREVAGTPRFLTAEEKTRWEEAGSPMPPPFDPEYQQMVLEAQRSDPNTPRSYVESTRESFATPGVVDMVRTDGWEGFRFPDTSRLPTDPKALRRSIERNQIPLTGFNLMYAGEKRLGPAKATSQLLNILSEGNPMTPQLRAAIFYALSELPGVEVDTDAIDSLGRHGYSITSIDKRSGGGLEYIFDPETAAMLAQRTFLGDRNPGPYRRGLPAGLTIRETAYIETGIVDSVQETAAEAEAGEPVATTGPSYRE